MGSALDENSRSLLSKMATNDGHGENSPYFDGWKAYDSDPYHPINNPKGVIQMGLAENQLCADLIRDWISQNPEASICTTQGLHAFMDVANFQDYHGFADFRQGLAKFMGAARGGRVSFDPDRIVMSGGATGANETIIFCLADPGDVFLVPSPYYPAFDRDLRWRTGVKIVPIRCESSDNFQVTRTALEESYEKARQQNLRVKGVILTNPSNPLGTVADGATLRDLVRFVTDKKIHLVCDEIYAATVFATPNFISVAEVVSDTPCNLDLIHIVYSLSKDMGLPGFRVGIVYSYNDAVVATARRMSSFGLVSSQTQRLLAKMLSDDEFVGRFLSESARRLGDRHRKLTRGLAEVGIGCLKSNAGLYCWMDLRGLLKEATEAEELALWRLIIKDVKLNVSPGSAFRCPEPGWFRVCFANMGDEVVDVALERITKFVGRGKGTVETAAKRKRWQNSTLRLSFSGRNNRYDEGIMSPRSPMPHSPLVEART